MSYILINPVNFILENAPCHSVPLLMGILKNDNIENSFLNINSILVNNLKNRDFINKILDKINDLSNYIPYEENPFIKEIGMAAKSSYAQININRFLHITGYALSVLKSKYWFYKIGLCHYSYMIAFKALTLLAILYSEIVHILIPNIDNNLTNSEKPEISLNIDLLEEFYSGKMNYLKDFFEETIDKSINEEVECVGISINSPIQLITGLYICKYIKSRYKCHINIGGAFFNEYYTSFVNLPDLFEKYFDSISIDNNTETITAQINYLRGKIAIEEVPNIIYMQNNTLKINKGNSTLDFSNIPFIDLGKPEDISYPLPYLVLPLQASTSCYWGKCIFCDCSANKDRYTLKKVTRLVDEIEYLKNKYKTKYFYFWDNALHPNYLNELADELNKRKIKIFYSIYARFEPEFNYKLLKKLRKAGLAHVCWGLDSASERVLKYINKGITTENAERILKDATRANVYNKVYLIFGHPTETLDEIKESINFINKNEKYVGDVMANSKVLFLPHSIIQQQRDYYKSQILTTDKERGNLVKQIKKSCNESILMSFSPTSLLLLDKYSVKTLGTKLKIYLKLQRYKFYKSYNLNFFNLLYKIRK